jgi:Na+/H+-dicarboxylate symporter
VLIAAVAAGVGLGWVCNRTLDAGQIRQLAEGLGVVTDLFLRLIRMIIAPLVLTTLISGIAHMEDAGAVGRVGAKTLGWFLAAALASLVIGLVMVNLVQPGSGLSLTPPPIGAKAGVEAAAFSLPGFVTHLVPASIVDALAQNQILQIVVFSVFVGTAIAAMPGRAPVVLAAVEQSAAIMLKVTGYVMKTAPAAVFAALASTVASQGIGVLAIYARFVGGFYLSLGLLWAALFAAAFLIIGPRARDLFRAIRIPVLLAFSTASSEAAYPRTLEQLEAFGVAPRIASFVLPLGYSFNLDGTAVYCTFAVMFIAQAYGVHLTLAQQAGMLLLLLVTSKGIAGVPRAALVVVMAALPVLHLPEGGVLLVLAVDHLLDMGRSATNVAGNCVAAAVVGRWEGQLGPGAESV